MKIILLVAVIVLVAALVAAVIGYRRWSGKRMARDARWEPFVRSGGSMVFPSTQVLVRKASRKGVITKVYDSLIVADIRNDSTNYDQRLHDARQSAFERCITLNS